MSTIFLDRDGVINENRSDYVKSWAEFKFLPGSREAIARLTQAGHRIIVCTNQAGIARGTLSVETVEDIHLRMIARIQDGGGKIEKVYYCPHDRDGDCSCRKPRPGMLLRACHELSIDLHDAIFIGDSITDIRAAHTVGIHAILVLSGLGLSQFLEHHHEVNRPFRIGINLMDAAELVLNGLHVPAETQSSLERACYSFLGLAEQLDSRSFLEDHNLQQVTLTF